MVRMHHWPAFDEEPITAKALSPREKVPAGGQSPNGRNQFGSLVGDEPGIEPPNGLCAWSAIDHDARARMGDEETRRRV
jgi:hypothetical protein